MTLSRIGSEGPSRTARNWRGNRPRRMLLEWLDVSCWRAFLGSEGVGKDWGVHFKRKAWVLLAGLWNEGPLSRYACVSLMYIFDLLNHPLHCSPSLWTAAEFDSPSKFEIVRHSQPWGTVSGDSGLFFIAYSCTPEAFDYMLDRMTGHGPEDKHCDDVMRMTQCVTGAYWYFPGQAEFDAMTAGGAGGFGKGLWRWFRVPDAFSGTIILCLSFITYVLISFNPLFENLVLFVHHTVCTESEETCCCCCCCIHFSNLQPDPFNYRRIVCVSLTYILIFV